MKITANTLLQALLTRHHKEVCVPECKTGPTQGGGPGLLIMDLWVMFRSWTNPRTICYEIKVDRSDFLNDNKWRNYLDFCSEFYFVVPQKIPKVIEPNELPPEAGLLVSSINGNRLYCKKKAVSRKVLIPDLLWRYILMARTTVVTERTFSQKGYWESWLKDKKINQEFGYMVSKAIQETIKTEIKKVKSENETLKYENERLEEVRRSLEALGFDKGINHWEFERKYKILLREIEAGIPEGLEQYLAGLITNAQKIQEIIKARAVK